MFERYDQRVDIIARVVHRQRGSSRRWNTKAVHDRLRTVVACPDSHTLSIDNRANIMWMYAFHYEGQNAGLLRSRSDQLETGNLLERVRCIRQKFAFMECYLIEPKPGQILDGCTESNRTCLLYTSDAADE